MKIIYKYFIILSAALIAILIFMVYLLNKLINIKCYKAASASAKLICLLKLFFIMSCIIILVIYLITWL